MVTWQGCIQRILILVIGAAIGVMMYLWLVVTAIGGEGVVDQKIATIWSFGGVLLVIGGILGACMKRWVALLPGAIVSTIANASFFSVVWIFIVSTVLLLRYCMTPQQHNLEEVHIDLTNCIVIARDAETEEGLSYDDDKDCITSNAQ